MVITYVSTGGSGAMHAQAGGAEQPAAARPPVSGAAARPIRRARLTAPVWLAALLPAIARPGVPAACPIRRSAAATDGHQRRPAATTASVPPPTPAKPSALTTRTQPRYWVQCVRRELQDATMHVLHVNLRGNASCFDRDAYAAPAGETFAIEITNSAWTLSDQPLSATVLISPSSDPARAPVPGRPGFGTCITSKAVFVAPTVSAPHTRTFSVQPLSPGDYVLQLSEGWCHQDAALVVSP